MNVRQADSVVEIYKTVNTLVVFVWGSLCIV